MEDSGKITFFFFFFFFFFFLGQESEGDQSIDCQ